MKSQARILIIDDELPIREVLSANLRDEGHEVLTAPEAESGLKAMQEFKPDLVFLDIWMPGSLDGIEVLTTARKRFSELEFVMISGHGTIETAVKATKLGAWDFIEKPLSMDKISIVIANIMQYQSEKKEKEALLNKLRRSIALIGEAPAIVALKQMIARVAPTQGWVLLLGEKGSGKELVAQNVHYLSPRASRPFVEISVSSIPEDLIEAELFGVEKGVLAGGMARKGKIELAHGGTVYIDDMTSLNPDIQEKLLRLMQDRKIFRVGSNQAVASQAIECDVRLIAASDKDIEQEIAKGHFREDLYHRINVSQFRVPSLREHAEDIPALVSHFSDQAAKDGGFLKKEFSEKGIAAMREYPWPGNVRELRNFIERVYILTPGEFVDLHDLRFAGLPTSTSSGSLATDLSTFREARAQFEKEYLLKKIAENQGNISRTAEVIGLERSYLHRKIKAFGIEVTKGADDL